jgi:hypothetical protein
MEVAVMALPRTVKPSGTTPRDPGRTQIAWAGEVSLWLSLVDGAAADAFAGAVRGRSLVDTLAHIETQVPHCLGPDITDVIAVARGTDAIEALNEAAASQFHAAFVGFINGYTMGLALEYDRDRPVEWPADAEPYPTDGAMSVLAQLMELAYLREIMPQFKGILERSRGDMCFMEGNAAQSGARAADAWVQYNVKN